MRRYPAWDVGTVFRVSFVSPTASESADTVWPQPLHAQKQARSETPETRNIDVWRPTRSEDQRRPCHGAAHTGFALTWCSRTRARGEASSPLDGANVNRSNGQSLQLSARPQTKLAARRLLAVSSTVSVIGRGVQPNTRLAFSDETGRRFPSS